MNHCRSRRKETPIGIESSSGRLEYLTRPSLRPSREFHKLQIENFQLPIFNRAQVDDFAIAAKLDLFATSLNAQGLYGLLDICVLGFEIRVSLRRLLQ
jgi:hypothetical protein